ncbi:pyridine nucleotide-disulfide oxidoreductase family protein [Wolffia australiana]
MRRTRISQFLRQTGWWRRSIHVCVVGSGPAGLYTTEKILKQHNGAIIDIVDRLPTPFGLVRTGVAPDHQETKIVINQFSRTASNERCSFFGNLSLGRDISLSELRDIYDIVVLAYGAESDRTLNIPGEDLPNIHSAREFVWWYNGHPDCSNMSPNIQSTDTAIILGQGNVALDIARILLRPTRELETTDMADYALEALHRSSIRKVLLIGRRGPAQAACTAKELREILSIKDLRVHIKKRDLLTSSADEEELNNDRRQRRVYELLAKASSSLHSVTSTQKELHFIFFRKPHQFLPSFDNRVRGVSFEKTCLAKDFESGKRFAVGTGQFEELDAGLVLKSIGYKSVSVPGLAFDKQRGVVPNIKGRVVKANSDQTVLENGLYVVGWLKRGPTGIIATNLYCAEETVESVLEDLEKGTERKRKQGRPGLVELLESRDIQYVTFMGWEKIDMKEKAEGIRRNRPRIKITEWGELLRVANE